MRRNVEVCLTHTRDSISRVPRMTRAVERALGVGTVGVSVTVVMVVLMVVGQVSGFAFVNI